MSKRQTYYEDCRMLYVRNNDLSTISQTTGVSMTTLSKWKQEGDWEQQRKQFNRRPLAMAERINEMMEKIVDEVCDSGGKINAEQADQLSKLAAVKKTLSSAEDLPSMVIAVTDLLSQFVRRTVKDENLAGQFSQILGDFYQKVKEENYGA
jgi:hypothetical protein